MSLDLKADELEKQIMLARGKAIDFNRQVIKLKKELFIANEEIEDKTEEIRYRDYEINDLKKEIFRLQEIDEDLCFELEQVLSEVKYWYRLKYPSFKTVFIKYMERIKNAYNNFKRSESALWKDRLQFIRKNKVIF